MAPCRAAVLSRTGRRLLACSSVSPSIFRSDAASAAPSGGEAEPAARQALLGRRLLRRRECVRMGRSTRALSPSSAARAEDARRRRFAATSAERLRRRPCGSAAAGVRLGARSWSVSSHRAARCLSRAGIGLSRPVRAAGVLARSVAQWLTQLRGAESRESTIRHESTARHSASPLPSPNSPGEPITSPAGLLMPRPLLQRSLRLDFLGAPVSSGIAPERRSPPVVCDAVRARQQVGRLRSKVICHRRRIIEER